MWWCRWCQCICASQGTFCKFKINSEVVHILDCGSLQPWLKQKLISAATLPKCSKSRRLQEKRRNWCVSLVVGVLLEDKVPRRACLGHTHGLIKVADGYRCSAIHSRRPCSAAPPGHPSPTISLNITGATACLCGFPWPSHQASSIKGSGHGDVCAQEAALLTQSLRSKDSRIWSLIILNLCKKAKKLKEIMKMWQNKDF